jgi:hypothetical protein
MVENTNSTTLEVQGSFGLTYMVGFIQLNLRSQEMDKGVPCTRAPPPPARLGVAGRQVGRGRAGGRGDRGESLALETDENRTNSESQVQPQVRVFPSRSSARILDCPTSVVVFIAGSWHLHLVRHDK